MTREPDTLTAEAFLQASSPGGAEPGPPILDVRSPGEFAAGHIPGAISFPLFDDEERAAVGTSYHVEGREAAIQLGLELVGSKLAGFVAETRQIGSGRPILLHCWRGGMRSGSMAWLLRTAGMQVSVLRGGYKAYRQLVLSELGARGHIIVLGGRTGSGKTESLCALEARGAQVIDLERIANHFGSAFGNLGDDPQPTNEQFSNEVHRQLRAFSTDRPIWIEDESRSIGRVWQPEEWFPRIRDARVLVLERTIAERITHLETMYGAADRAQLSEAFGKIRKRLGGQNEKAAQSALGEGDLAEAARIALHYYDKAYDHGLATRDEGQLLPYDGRGQTFEQIAEGLEALEPRLQSEPRPGDAALSRGD